MQLAGDSLSVIDVIGRPCGDRTHDTLLKSGCDVCRGRGYGRPDAPATPAGPWPQSSGRARDSCGNASCVMFRNAALFAPRSASTSASRRGEPGASGKGDAPLQAPNKPRGEGWMPRHVVEGPTTFMPTGSHLNGRPSK